MHKDIKKLSIQNFVFLLLTEACITSNIIGRTVESVEKHHFKYWLDKDHPVVLCVGSFSSQIFLLVFANGLFLRKIKKPQNLPIRLNKKDENFHCFNFCVNFIAYSASDGLTFVCYLYIIRM